MQAVPKVKDSGFLNPKESTTVDDNIVLLLIAILQYQYHIAGSRKVSIYCNDIANRLYSSLI